MSLPLRPIDIELAKNLEALEALKNWPAERRAIRETEEVLRIASERAKAAQREEDRRILQRQINERSA